MKVVLFKDMRAEGWPSMDRYGESLIRQFKIQNSEFKVFKTEPPIKSSRFRMFWRDQVYPRWAGRNQGEVNHVLDHSYGHLLNFLVGQRTVVTCHDLLPLEFERNGQIRERFKRIVANLKKAAFIIADSLATKADLIKRLGLAEGRTKVIYLGVDPIFRPLESEEEKKHLRRKFNLPEGRIIFSHGQATLPYKNTEGILRAFIETSRSQKDIYLLRVNPLTASQRALLKTAGLEKRFLEVVRPSDEQLSQLYSLADVFLSPSFKEGFGLPVLQALACGIPVVITPRTSLEEIAGDLGFYADPQDIGSIARAVGQVLAGGFDRESYRRQAVRRAQEFSWVATARQTYEVYEEVFRHSIII